MEQSDRRTAGWLPAPICPDFVIEVRSPNDRMKRLKAKMTEYIDNGARLAWLLDPIDNKAYVYRLGEPVQEIEKPDVLSGDPILPGFRFDFKEILYTCLMAWDC